MKRQSKWVVTIGETLKSKQRRVVTTRQVFENGRNEEIKILSSNNVYVEEEKKKPHPEDA